MTHLASFTRAALASVAVLALASACGGSSFTNGGEGGDSGSNNGGSNSSSGSHTTAGKATAGSNSSSGTATGGGGPTGGSTGTGGSSPGGEACNAPAMSGNCNAYFERWFHDPSTGLCRPFVYGGCGGNDNNYETLEACQKACPGGSPNYDACTAPSDCVVSAAGCCGVCDGPDITTRDLISYNRKYQTEVTVCAGDVLCAPCPAPLPGEGSMMYFVPDCVAGQCAVKDIRTSPVTACQTADECRLRNGTGCCEGCGGGGDVIAVRNDGSFEKLVCGSDSVACPACEPLLPEGAVAVCVEGHCQAAYLAATD